MIPRTAAAALAAFLGVVAPATAAYAHGPQQRPAAAWTSTGGWTGTLGGTHDGPGFARCPMSSAAEGNANQQNFPVKQYGQVAGGTICR